MERIENESTRRELFYILLKEKYLEDFRRGQKEGAVNRFLKLVEDASLNEASSKGERGHE
jgi:hypothetical protein